MVLVIESEISYDGFQLDVLTAFLNAGVEEDVHVKIATGYPNTNKTGEPPVMRLPKNPVRLAQLTA